MIFESEVTMEQRKYRVKMSWIFNLESMQDRLWCIEYDIEEGKIQLPIEVAGKQIKDIDELADLREECSDLEWTAKSGKVTGKEYGRIKQIVEWRVNARYMTCMANGMSERDAGACFEDL
jgi:hypothetical protein